MGNRQYRLPSADELWPRPYTDARMWLPWSEDVCTTAVVRGLWRAIHDVQHRENTSEDQWALRQGEAKGLLRALRIIEEEEDASKQKASDSVEEVE